ISQILNEITVTDLLNLDAAVIAKLEKVVSGYAKDWDLVSGLISKLEEAGQNSPQLKKMALWVQFLAGKISSENEEFSKHFASYFHLEPQQFLLIVKDLIRRKRWAQAFSYLVRHCEVTDDYNDLVKA